jgi:hypothetical protein
MMQPTWARAVRELDRRRGDHPRSRAGFEKNAAAFTAVTVKPVRVPECLSYAWGQTPLLHVGLNENKAALPEIDMQATGTIEVVTAEANKRVLKSTTVACEKKLSRFVVDSRGTLIHAGRDGVSSALSLRR